MRLSDYADVVRRNVTATEVAGMLDLKPNKAGFCKCPLHGEKTGSMKLYPGNRGWYCFGCHQGGSVIDLVMMYYGLDLKGAIQLLNDEFHLGLPIGYKPTKEQELAAKRRAEQRELERSIRDMVRFIQNTAFELLCDVGYELCQLELDKREYAPKTAEEEFDPRFVNALIKIDILKEDVEFLQTICVGKEDE